MNYDETIFVVRTVWVGVLLARNTMGGPAGVSNANVGQDGFAVFSSAEVCGKMFTFVYNFLQNLRS